MSASARGSSTAPRVGFALTAYAGTGKDTFVREVQSGKLTLRPCGLSLGATASEDVRWAVYALRGRDATDLSKLLLDPEGASLARRYAFADALKNMTHEWLGFLNCPPLAFENVKDSLMAKDPVTGEMKTMRKHYIDYGQARRRKDPLVWAKIVSDAIQHSERRCYDVTTDWRFDNELACRPHPPATVRLFRDEVKVAEPLEDRRVDSEHNLDGYLTDYLFVPPGQFKTALEKFPQYAHHVPLCFIVEK